MKRITLQLVNQMREHEVVSEMVSALTWGGERFNAVVKVEAHRVDFVFHNEAQAEVARDLATDGMFKPFDLDRNLSGYHFHVVLTDEEYVNEEGEEF